MSHTMAMDHFPDVTDGVSALHIASSLGLSHTSSDVAAAEAAVGLAILLSLYRNRVTVDMESFNLLKW